MKKVLAFLLFLAALPLPYDYYIYLRVIVFLSVIFLAIQDWKYLLSSNKAMYVVIAILFNPFSPIYISKGIWVIVDIVCGIYFLKMSKDITKT